MSKSQNYIIVLGGVFAIIFVLIIGLIKYFFYQSEQIEIGKQIIDMLIAVIPAMMFCAMTMVGILNYVEKKEVKAATKLNNEFRADIIKQFKKISDKEENTQQTLGRIEENIAINEHSEATRNEELKEYFADQKTKEANHAREHKNINTKLTTFDEWMIQHKYEHKTT